ncbi:MAG: alpha-glucosidase/alpha-galactosidase [Clostridiales bacterium]|jgi:alpha-galactosidase|nr:alpha-glucosidase/alpha-galactosidase [Clostridiales bacterium]
MNYENGNVGNLTVAYIGGGSRGWAWGFMKDLAMDGQMEGIVRLYDIDKPAAEKNKIIGEKISAHPEVAASWKYEVADTLADALDGAEIVVISILPGTFAEMRIDVHAPERYNIFQPVGDTVGPGGFVRALRSIPMFTEIGEAIKQYSPKAWVINYTNPMALCLAALYEVFPKIRAFGCCHEVFGTQKLLASMLKDSLGIEGVSRNDIHINVLGINHFTWFDSASYQHLDLFPLYNKFAQKYYDTGFSEGRDDNWMNDHFESAHRVKFDLFLRFGLIAAAGDRHLAEYMPDWYLRDSETIRNWKFSRTSIDWREEDLRERLNRSARLVSGEEDIEMAHSGEEGHLLIKALLGLGNIISNVNLPNHGQIDNLPRGAVVETNALFRRGEILPVNSGDLPGNLLPIISRFSYNQINTLRAAINCDYKLALTTFLNDPMNSGLNPAEGDELLKLMLNATKAYLPAGWGL